MSRRSVNRGEVIWLGAVRRAAWKQFSSSADRTRERLRPAVLVEDAKQEAKSKAAHLANEAMEPVRRHAPLAIGAVLAGGLLLIARPLLSAIRKPGNKRDD